MDERLYLAETHCFNQDGRHILLDVRQGRFFGLTSVENEALTAAGAESPAGPITYLELNVAQDCNLRCQYCSVGQGGFGARRWPGRPWTCAARIWAG